MRYLPLFLASLWRVLAPPSRGRHARPPQPASSRRHPRPRPQRRPERRVPDSRLLSPTVALSAPTRGPMVLDEALIRPYYRAWEKKRRRPHDRYRQGTAVPYDLSEQLPDPDLADLATAIRQWQNLGVGV
ncbi:hypothetical protein SUDANB121_02917 [Nocardiopsis dassonvillei]